MGSYSLSMLSYTMFRLRTRSKETSPQPMLRWQQEGKKTTLLTTAATTDSQEMRIFLGSKKMRTSYSEQLLNSFEMCYGWQSLSYGKLARKGTHYKLICVVHRINFIFRNIFFTASDK